MLSKLERRLGRRLRPIGRPKKRETVAKGKAKAIGRTNFRYAQYVTRLHSRSGHLWQNRFFSCALDEVHCWRTLAYVERNPVRARMVRKAWRYPWSSALAHAGEADRSGLLDMEW